MNLINQIPTFWVMITKIYGTIDSITGKAVIAENGGIYYEVYMPPVQLEQLRKTHSAGEHILLYTQYYIEGGVGIRNLLPRLIGFLAESDREFFEIFTTVKGLGERKALLAISIPISEIGYAIESGDVFTLKKLPGIGGRMADKIVAELKGKVTKFAAALEGREAVGAPREIPDFEEEALDVLISQLGYRRVEAENLIRKALTGDKSIDSVEALLQTIFMQNSPVENA